MENLKERSENLINFIFSNTRGFVQSGPFRGMIVSRKYSWGIGRNLCPKLLGTYEEELHSTIHRFLDRLPSVIINIGCAEGYYAVGLALLAPNCKHYAYDNDQYARRICRENAGLNGLENKITVLSDTTGVEFVKAIDAMHPSLIMCDIEGGEEQLFSDDTVIHALRYSYMIIETHASQSGHTLGKIFSRFSSSHDIELIKQAGRNPHSFSFLSAMPEFLKWESICENRSESQCWLALSPKCHSKLAQPFI